MFDIGWSEMAVIALLTLIVIGPRELPRVMRTVGQWVRKAQSLAREFQRGLDDMAREADLEDAKKLIDTGRSIANPKKMVMDTLDASDTVGEEFKDLQKAMRAEPVDDPADDKASEASKGAGAETDSPPPPEEPPAKEPPAKEPPAADEPVKATVKATVIKHPTNIAPPDSITPPPDPTAKPAAEPKAKPKPKAKAKPRAKPKAKPATTTAGSDGSQKTA